jgi:hypothetical protein
VRRAELMRTLGVPFRAWIMLMLGGTTVAALIIRENARSSFRPPEPRRHVSRREAPAPPVGRDQRPAVVVQATFEESRPFAG